jgi:hypothetical protein
MLRDERLREREPEPGAALAPRHQRKKDPVANRVRNAGPVVLDLHGDGEPMALPRQRHVAGNAGCEANARIGGRDGERLRRVAHDVEHGLRELLGVGVEFRQADIEVADHSRMGKLRLNHALHPHQDLVNVRAPVRGQPVRCQQPVHQRLQPVRLADHDLRVFDQLRSIELSLEQLRRAPDSAERILDLVREIAHELAVRLLLLVQTLLARDLQLLIDVPELEQQCGIAAVDRRDGAGEMEPGLAVYPQFEFLLGIGSTAFDHLSYGRQ